MALLWADRFAWSGEIPTSYPGLNPVALTRIDQGTGNGQYADVMSSARQWQHIQDGSGVAWGRANGPRGARMQLNGQDPNVQRGRLQLDNFAGLWPSSGRVLIGGWFWQSYTMNFNPLLDTRATDPFVYLSTAGGTGNPRMQVYSATGGILLDQYESALPWRQTTDGYFLGMMISSTGTAQLLSVHEDGRSWVGPVRSFTGTPNFGSSANLDVFSLRASNYWESGFADEILVAHPTTAFNLANFAAAIGRGVYADGQERPGNDTAYTVTESGITRIASGTGTIRTGAEAVTWDREPTVQNMPAGSVASLSSNGGSSWTTPTSFPESFTGLMRWNIPLLSGTTFTGATLTVPTTPAPTLAAISPISLLQGEIAHIPLTFTLDGSPSWTVTAPEIVTGTVTGGTLSVVAGFQVGTTTMTVTLTDHLGRSVSRTVQVTVTARTWVGGTPPRYPHAPIVLWDDNRPESVLIDPMVAMVTKEVNGALDLTLILPISHRSAGIVKNERVIEVAGERYRTRRVKTLRQSGVPMLEVYAEAGFYDLATAGQINAREWTQVTAGEVMQHALAGTGWSVDIANQTSLRTYTTEDTNPLELLRTIQSQHGGDLLFDNKNRKVSLVSSSGRDDGVAFFHGKGLTDAQRVVDTTSLVTRIYARNADGVTIASVNNGRDYVEDFSYTSEIRTAVYDFKSGTSPYTMLSMANATLANRCKPDMSYEVTVEDLSAVTDQDMDRFDAGDYVTVVDQDLGISERQRVVRLEYDVVRPAASKITLSGRLREMGSSDSSDAGMLETGAMVNSFDLVPYNLFLNGRFDNQLAHWAHHGVEVVEGNGTGDYAVQFTGSGERWIEQTVQPDNRDAYALSFDIVSTGPSGWVPDVTAQAVVTYEDGTSETIDLEIA